MAVLSLSLVLLNFPSVLNFHLLSSRKLIPVVEWLLRVCLDLLVDLNRKTVALSDDSVLLNYCLKHPLRKRIRNAYLGTISGQKFSDTLNIENFLMVNVSACVP